MPWVSRRLRGQRVFVRARPDGQPASDGAGRVDVLYKQAGRVYRAAARNLEPDPASETWSDAEAAPSGAAAPAASDDKRAAPPVPADAFVIYPDSAAAMRPAPIVVERALPPPPRSKPPIE